LPADVSLLRRGAIAIGVFPFAAQFPMTYIDNVGAPRPARSVEEYVRARRGKATAVEVRVKLRPLLLLHDGTRGENDDVLGLRINSVKAHHKTRSSWPRIDAQEHPFFFHLPKSSSYGLPEESIISMTALTAAHKSAIYGVRGALGNEDMQAISERLQRVLSLDLSRQIAAASKDLLRRAGLLADEE
jgi:hypothetical protein